jgi:two-component system osmolarity sensor histidine kinase EnvZ
MQLRDYMPKTLFGRMLGIIMVPMIIVQIVTIFIFYERHWDSVTRHMASGLGSEIDYIVSQAGALPDEARLEQITNLAARYFSFKLRFNAGAILEPYDATSTNIRYSEEAFADVLASRLSYPWTIDLESLSDFIQIEVQLGNGVLVILADRKRLISSTSWTFFGWTVGSSILLFGIAVLFLKAQVKPIIQLANAARSLGLGRQTDDWHLQGAKEVRLAGRAFQSMRHRINRQLAERTAMLAGVSHDLRTPLTRMRLQLALMPSTAETTALDQDVGELEQMIDGYLAFARGEGTEQTETANLADILTTIVVGFEKTNSGRLTLELSGAGLPDFPMRKQAMRRALENIIGNAVRYASYAEIRAKYRADNIFIFVDDNGPGIAEEHRADAVRPFVRLEESRNKETGGTGLGLAIANDIILGHGGELSFDDSHLGGLKVTITLPV